MSNLTKSQEQVEDIPSPKVHVHTDDTHEAIADNIFSVISKHKANNNGQLHPNQLVPGASILNQHIKAGRMPGGAEGEAIRKMQMKKEAAQKEENEKHVIK